MNKLDTVCESVNWNGCDFCGLIHARDNEKTVGEKGEYDDDNNRAHLKGKRSDYGNVGRTSSS